MDFKEFVNMIRKDPEGELNKLNYLESKPCSQYEVEKAEKSFIEIIGHPFPGIYKEILLRFNGFESDEICVFPVKNNKYSELNILEENVRYRELCSDRFIYIAMAEERDDGNLQLYVFDVKDNDYSTMEFSFKKEDTDKWDEEIRSIIRQRSGVYKTQLMSADSD